MESVTLTIDGQQVTVPKGTLIIRAAEQLGTIVPRFCDHPLLDPIGACRQCVVEVEGQRKPVMSCTMPVADDMVVRTHLTSDVAAKAQEGTLEFLLINHPLDCPMCDKGGECPLQDQALVHGSNTSRFVDQKRRYDKPVAISPQVLLDRERCVLCARCTRFSSEISGDRFIELFERGALEQVAIYEDEPYHSYYSGNIIQICPVGALTSADYRFKARPFDVVTTPSVCTSCSSGCNLTVQSRRGDIQRQLARTNMAVNESWICDKGRFGFHHLQADTRLTEPKLRSGDQLAKVSWADALMRATEAIQQAKDAGSGRVAVVTGSRLPVEDSYLVSKYVRTVLGSDDIDHRTRLAPASEADELTALVGRPTATFNDVEHAPVIVVAGLDPEEEAPILHLRMRKAWRNHTAKIVVVGPHLGTLADLAWRRVACAPGEEASVLAGLLDATTGTAGEIAEALKGDGAPVVLVGERAGAGSITAAYGLADAAGGHAAYIPRRGGARGALEAGLLAGVLPGGRRLEDEQDRAAVEQVWGTTLPTAPGRDLDAILTAAAAGEIDVLHLIGVDLARDCSSPALAERALAKVKTVIAQDLALTDTVERFADVVLPAAGTQERAGSTTNWEGRTQRFARAVDAPDLAQEDWEIIVQLAALLGHDLGVSDLETIRAEMERLGARATPHELPADVAAPDRPSGDGLVPVLRPQLLSGSTMLAGATDLVATARAEVAHLNPVDAGAAADGDLIEVTGPGGTIELPVRHAPDVLIGTVVLPTIVASKPTAAVLGEDRDVRVTLRAASSSTGAEVA